MCAIVKLRDGNQVSTIGGLRGSGFELVKDRNYPCIGEPHQCLCSVDLGKTLEGYGRKFVQDNAGNYEEKPPDPETKAE